MSESSSPCPVKTLQRMLRDMSYTDIHIPAVAVDGIFSEATCEAVQAFQRTRGLMPTGTVDEATWNALVSGWREARRQLAPPEPLLLQMERGACYTAGCTNRNLFVIQAMLHTLQTDWSDLPSVSVTGQMDADTAAAVRYLQQRSGLPVTGQIDKAFWDLLARAYRLCVGAGDVG